MPNRPFAPEDVERLHRSCPFVGVVGATPTSPDAHPSESSEEYATNTLVVSTDGGTRLLRRAEDLGWVVDRERDHEADEDPYTVGVDVFAEAAPGTRLAAPDARAVLDESE